MTSLSRVLGQDSAVRWLREAIRTGRLHHALLFAGPDGVGKRTTALALAAVLACEEARAYPDRADGGPSADSLGEILVAACGLCASCRALERGMHPDLHIVSRNQEPDGKKARRRARPKDISIDQVRELQAELARKPALAPRRIAIFEEAQDLSMPAQNALLKTLEEPPGAALLVLCASRPAALTPTIRSRCQRINFLPLAAAIVGERLREERGLAAADARLVADHAAGSLGLALRLEPASLREAEKALDEILAGLRPGAFLPVPPAGKALLDLDPLLGVDAPAYAGIHLLARRLGRELRESALIGDDGSAAPGKRASLRARLRALDAVLAAIRDLDRYANESLAVEQMLVRVAAERHLGH